MRLPAHRRKFFMASRRQANYSVSSLRAVVCAATSHARLHIRDTVSIADALVGIMVVEETVELSVVVVLVMDVVIEDVVLVVLAVTVVVVFVVVLVPVVLVFVVDTVLVVLVP